MAHQWFRIRYGYRWSLLWVLLLVIWVRLYRIGTLPSEFYGDIATLYEYVSGIKNGNFPRTYNLGVGPLYPYLLTPWLDLFGMSYTSAKLSNVFWSLVGLLGIYGLAREVGDRWLGLLALLVAGTGSWLLIFSRLGDLQASAVAVSSVALWLAVRSTTRQSLSIAFAAGAIAGCGLYIHPQTMGLPLATLLLVIFWQPQPTEQHGKVILACLGGLIFSCGPFISVLQASSGNFGTQGYIGSKFGGLDLDLIRSNVSRALQGLFILGDSNRRGSIAGVPLLDQLSQTLLLVGIGWWLHKARRWKLPLLLATVAILWAPSLLVGNPNEVPSASRTVSSAGVIYILIASGIYALGQGIPWRNVGIGFAIVLCIGVVGINLERYFVRYETSLPYQNAGVASAISTFAQDLAPETTVMLVRCCWQEGMPEPKSIRYPNPDLVFQHFETGDLTCDRLQAMPRPLALVWAFQNPLPDPNVAACADQLTVTVHQTAEGKLLFNSALLR